MKKRVIVFTLFLILSFCVVAEELPTFELDNAVVAPPLPPETVDEGKLEFQLELKDYDTKKLINDTHVDIALISDKTINTLQYVGSSGILKLVLEPGDYEIVLKVDKIETDGKDYFYKGSYTVISDSLETVMLLGAGSVRGIVYNAKGEALRNAIVEVECTADYGEKDATKTDRYGSFAMYWLPEGHCRISAAQNNRVGFENVNIEKGDLEEVEIKLGGTIAESNYLWLMIIAVLIGAAALMYFRKPKVAKKETTKIMVVRKKEYHPRILDIMRTLKDNEKKIAEYLLENKGKTTQAYIKNSLGIPKTSLARSLKMLEAKNVVSIERIGKMKKVNLTDWFLGKE